MRKRIMSLALAIIVMVTSLQTVVFATATSAEFIGYDATTLGAWNGVYGKDGYILFGYNSTPDASDVIDGVNYTSDIVEIPSYLELIDGNPYKMNDKTQVKVNPGYYDNDDTVLDPPVGITQGKVKASAEVGADDFTDSNNVDHKGGVRTFEFHLTGDDEQIFTIYSNANVGYRHFEIRDLLGNVLLPYTVGGTLLGEYPENAYVSFKVNGSFVFEFSNEWNKGLAGAFFDTPGSAQPPAPTVNAEFLSYDKATLGAWNGVYGKDGYILFGYNSTPDASGTVDGVNYTSDIVELPSYLELIDGNPYKMNSGTKVRVSPDIDDTVLEPPAGSALSKVKASAAIGDNDLTDSGGATHLGGVRTFEFHLTGDTERIFTIYTNGSAVNRFFEIRDLNGNILIPLTEGHLLGSGSGANVYASFKVNGSFVFEYTKEWENGLAGAFFDTPGSAQPPAPTVNAEFLSYDKATKGAWNGVYGKDGYILFGYNSTPDASGTVDGVNYTSDIVELPSYLELIDGNPYKMNSGTKVRVSPDSDDTVLDPPAGSSQSKVKASAAIGDNDFKDSNNVDHLGGVRTFEFHLTGDDERIFTIYSNANVGYRFFEIRDLSGNVLLPLTEGSVLLSGDHPSDTYMSFKVDGSFVFEYTKEWENGLAGAFFDTPGSAQPPQDLPGEYLGMDTSTQGAWNGKYGTSGFLLVGANVPKPDNWGFGGSVTDTSKYELGVSDIYVQPSYVTSVAWSDSNTFSPSPDDHSTDARVLDLPTGVAGDKHRADIESGSGLLTVNVTVSDNEPHIFSTYTSLNWNNGATVKLYDSSGQLVDQSPAIPMQDALGNGVYVSFLVQGSFKIVFEDTGGYAALSGIFFDEPGLKAPANLVAQALSAGEAIELTWTNTETDAKLIIERSLDGTLFAPLDELLLNETSYVDSGLTASQTYWYRLKYEKNVESSGYSNISSATASALPTNATAQGAFLSVNTSVRGNWYGNYGASGYLLVGANVPKPPNWGYGGGVDDTEKYKLGVSDIYEKPSYVSSIAWSATNGFSPSPDDHSENSSVLQLPPGVSGTKHKADIEASDPNVLTVKVSVSDNEPHIFSTYTSLNWGNGATVQLLDENGQLIAQSPHIEKGNTLGDGAYVSFMIQGSFQVVFAETGGWASLSGIFFDEPDLSIAIPKDLQAVARPVGRTIDLTWTNTETSAKAVLERSQDNLFFSKIAEFTQGESAYADANLVASQTYWYRVRYEKNGEFGLSTEVASATVPAMDLVDLEIKELSKDSVDIGETAEATVHLQRKSDGAPLPGTTVYLLLTGSHVGDGVTLGQEIPELLGEGTTDSNGDVKITLNPQYVGDYGVVAKTLPDDNSTPPVDGAISDPKTISVKPLSVSAPPTIFKLSDAVMPGSLFSINGSDLDYDSLKVWIKEASDDSFDGAIEVELVQGDKDGRFAVARLPEDATPGVYNVWAENGNGKSAPYKLNGTRPLFISDYEIYPGIEIEMAGRNFLGSEFGSEDDPKVRLVNSSGFIEGIVNLDNTNPYKIAFTISSGAAGAYYVEASNDSKNWARLSNGQTLTVVSPGANPDPLGLGVAWARDFNWENQIDVTDFGATGDDTSNDTAFVQAAVDSAATAGGVVFFPNGDYYIDTIILPSKVVLVGESKENAKLYYTAEASLGLNFINSIDITSDGTAGIPELQGVANLSLLLAHPDNPNARPDSFIWLGERWGASYSDKSLRTGNRLFVHNVKIDYPTDLIRTTENGKHEGSNIAGVTGGRGIGLEFIGNERILVQNNEFTGYHAVPFITGMNRYYLLKGNSFTYTFGYVVSLSTYFFAENNRLEAVRPEQNAETHGIFGRSNAYMEGNYVANTGAADNSYNDGEPLCVEVPNGYWNWGEVLKGSLSSITVAPKGNLTWPSLDYGEVSVLIVEGRGQGQLRKVKVPNPYPAGQSFGSYTIEVETPFDVAPDHTSKFTLIAPNENATFYNNEVVNNAKGIWLYGNSFDGLAANNKSVDSEGIFIWSNGGPTSIVPDYYSRIANNEVIGVSRRSGYGGIGFNTGRNGGRNYYYATDVYSTEILNNKVTGGENTSASGETEAPSLSGIYLWAASKASAYDNIDGTKDAVNMIVSGNELADLSTGVHLSHSNYGAIIQGNYYSDTVTAFLSNQHTMAGDQIDGTNTLIEDNTLGIPDTTPPTKPEDLAAEDITQTTLTLTWVESVDDVSKVTYKVYLGTELLGETDECEYAVTDLEASTTYQFVIVAVDEAGNEAESDPLEVTTLDPEVLPDTTPPTKPEDLAAEDVTQTTLTLTWLESTDESSAVIYKVYLGTELLGETDECEYAVTGLEASTTYQFTVIAVDEAGNEAESDPLEVTTLDPEVLPDTTPPTKPEDLAAEDVTQTTLTLTWVESTDESSVVIYKVYLGTELLGETDECEYAVTDLEASATYQFIVIAVDEAGNEAESDPFEATTLDPEAPPEIPDTTPPSKPSDLAAEDITQTTLTLTWLESVDDVSTVTYKVYLGAELLGETDECEYAVTGLEASATYQFKVVAVDEAGNEASSDPFEVGTLDPEAPPEIPEATPTLAPEPDTAPPSKPAGLAAENVTKTALKLTWDESVDSESSVIYKVYVDQELIGETADTFADIEGLTAGKTYVLVVVAVDEAGNEASSDPFEATTLADPTVDAPPSTPDYVYTPYIPPTTGLVTTFDKESGTAGIKIAATPSDAVTSVDAAQTAYISNAYIQALIARGKRESADVLQIKAEAGKDSKEVSLVIDESGYSKLAEYGKPVNIDLTVASVKLGSNELKALAPSGNKNISVSVKILDNGNPSYAFSASAGSASVTMAKVEALVPYELKAGQKERSVVVYEVSGSGQLALARSGYSSGSAKFQISDFRKEYVVGYNEISFADVPSGAWHEEPIGFLAARGIVSGTGNGFFAPSSPVKRADFLIMIMNAYGLKPDTQPEPNFDDAGSGYWAYYLSAAKRLGIAAGTGSNMFNPAAPITRQDMLVLLYRVLDSLNELPEGIVGRSVDSFGDASELAGYARNAVKLFVETGAIVGDGQSLSPQAQTSRAQAAQTLYALLKF
ncbi:MAG: fibronectin type III domain-containing protein [Clostridiales bacterium]|jgi:hypothetical protein|nr:fibronectin type III domain-containing protein [Clostridiales bacterium]